MQLRLIITGLCLWCLASACKQKAAFTSGGEANFSPAAGGSPSDPCGPAGTTKAELITPTLANGVQGNYLAYEISIADCDGKVRPLDANRILFDVDARFTGAHINAPLVYTVNVGDKAIEGELKNIQGSDLFGRTGANLFHYATEKKIELAPKTSSLRLRIDLAGHQMKSTTEGVSSPDQMATYLRFGDARAVQQMVSLQTPQQ